MQPTHEILDELLALINGTRQRLAKGKSKQIRGNEERTHLKSLAFAWFKSYRPVLLDDAPHLRLDQVDSCFRRLLDGTLRSTSRSTYANVLKDTRVAVGVLQREALVPPQNDHSERDDQTPDFTPLANDPEMRAVLEERWIECRKCIQAEAFLAATVMMGGLLEALLLARANRLQDKTPLFTSAAAPRQKTTGNPLPLSSWTLRNFIDVAHELGWVSRSGKDIAEVLRDYRNCVHPEKQRSHGVVLSLQDSRMFWDITKNLSRQLLAMQSVT